MNRRLFLAGLGVLLLNTAITGYAQEKTKIISLHFDDGPKPSVLVDLLPLLQTNDVHASFFVVGADAEAHIEWLTKEAEAGHTVENHSWGHENFSHVKNIGDIPKSLQKTAIVIERATGRHPKYVRPPFWELPKKVRRIIEAEGYRIVTLGDPDLSSDDWRFIRKPHAVEKIIRSATDIVSRRERQHIFHHSIVFHEAADTIEALRILLPKWHNDGYSFVNAEEYFGLT